MESMQDLTPPVQRSRRGSESAVRTVEDPSKNVLLQRCHRMQASEEIGGCSLQQGENGCELGP